MGEAAHHRADRQGQEGRPGEVPRGRRQRLHLEAPGRRTAALAGTRLDAQVRRVDAGSANFDIELQLLIEAVYLKYHYDFRQYARASLKRRVTAALPRFSCLTVSQLQDRVVHDPTSFPDLLDFLTVPVSDMFRDPAYYRALREHVVPVLRTYPSLKIWV